MNGDASITDAMKESAVPPDSIHDDRVITQLARLDHCDAVVRKLRRVRLVPNKIARKEHRRGFDHAIRVIDFDRNALGQCIRRIPRQRIVAFAAA